MRCAACAFKWTVEPSSGAELMISADEGFGRHLEDAERLERNLATMTRHVPANDIESAAGDGDAASSGRRPRFSGMIALAASLALVLGAAWEYRGQVVTAVPKLAALYDLAGISVNIRGMTFDNIVVEREFENGLPVLAVRGEIVNVSERMLEVPRVRFGLRDATDQELYHWTMAVSAGKLAPEQRARFATRLSAPPSEARDVVVRFHDAGPRRAAMFN